CALISFTIRSRYSGYGKTAPGVSTFATCVPVDGVSPGFGFSVEAVVFAAASCLGCGVVLAGPGTVLADFVAGLIGAVRSGGRGIASGAACWTSGGVAGAAIS